MIDVPPGTIWKRQRVLSPILFFTICDSASAGSASFYPADRIHAHSDGTGILVLFMALFAVASVAAVGRFYLNRFRRKRTLDSALTTERHIRQLTPYECLQVSDFFEREKRSRHLEGYDNKSGKVGKDVFRVSGPARSHSVSTSRGVIGCYQSIAGIEMLVPTSAIPFLQDNHNSAEFVMVGDLPLLISLNGNFQIAAQAKEDGETSIEVNRIGDTSVRERLFPKDVQADCAPSNDGGFLKSIRSHQLLASNETVSGSDVQFIFSIYWSLLLLSCFLGPVLLILMTGLFGYLLEGLDLALIMVLFVWPFIEMFLWTLPAVLLVWITMRLVLPDSHLMVFDRKKQQVLFYCKTGDALWVEWDDLYAMVETTDWMTSYGWPMQETFLELASANRDSSVRRSVRFAYSSEEKAFGAWRSIQAFMNEGLDNLPFHDPGSKTERLNRDMDQPPHQTLLSWLWKCLVYWFFGGPVAPRLGSWVDNQRQESVWTRISDLEN
ncbi:hypothetical protein [Marinobacter confluentis]|uniref:Uncharacterized protein n=2 Tax=Marinobacter confluentis TaxID=1697557 RepID=A0A4Z1BY62_9GAMM|nr:hypothetical protein [Marinobacter confluentis]TGN39460.1 hypothetical protein E5Q11_12610 [Marinobacter confluentis]